MSTRGVTEMMQDEAEGEDRLRAANGRLMAEIERLRAALREIAAVEPQSWTTLRARAALEQQAPSCAAWPACGCSPYMRRICETTGGNGTLFGPREQQPAPKEDYDSEAIRATAKRLLPHSVPPDREQKAPERCPPDCECNDYHPLDKDPKPY